MPTCETEQYELHAMKYRGEANSEAEAIDKVLNGTAMPVDDSLDYVEVAEDFEMPGEEYRQLAGRQGS